MNERFSIGFTENWKVCICDNGHNMDTFTVCDLLNKLYEENEFLNSYLEELEDSMFSEKDFSDYLQACHQGKVENIKR